MRLRYSKIRHDAPPALKVAWRLERRIRAIESATRAYIWQGTYQNRGHTFLKTSIGVIRISHSGAIRRAVEA